jgi:hypothetical protein
LDRPFDQSIRAFYQDRLKEYLSDSGQPGGVNSILKWLHRVLHPFKFEWAALNDEGFPVSVLVSVDPPLAKPLLHPARVVFLNDQADPPPSNIPVSSIDVELCLTSQGSQDANFYINSAGLSKPHAAALLTLFHFVQNPVRF